MTVTMNFPWTGSFLFSYLQQLALIVAQVPGSGIVSRYLGCSYQNDPIRSAIELCLFLFVVRYLLAARKPTRPNFMQLSEKEIDNLVDEWTPEPLVGEQTHMEKMEIDKRIVVKGPVSARSKLVNGHAVMNLGSHDFYNFNTDLTLQREVIGSLQKSGVGPCGPRTFYGTQDALLKAEADVASFLGTPACIIYSQAFSTISSVIPAFLKRGDIIVADKGVNYAIRRGIEISRSIVLWYEHSDMKDLERVLAGIVSEQARRPLTRRFIITEGLFQSFGDLVDLPKINELRFRYKFRLILDETCSFGVLGRTGRGVTEHHNINVTEIDMIVGSLAGPLVAGGGFCVGSEEVVNHQRIFGAAYAFSAALPAFLSTAASTSISLLQDSPMSVSQLRVFTKAMHAQLYPASNWVSCTSAPENPVLILALNPQFIALKKLSYCDQQFLLQDIVDECLANGVLICRLKTLEDNLEPKQLVPAALKVCVTIGLSQEEIDLAGKTISNAIAKVMNTNGSENRI